MKAHHRWLAALLGLALLLGLFGCSPEQAGDFANDFAGEVISELESEPAANTAAGSPPAGSGAVSAAQPEKTAPPPDSTASPAESGAALLDEDGSYTARDEVALYIHQYGRLPGNFINKTKARKLGWEGGSLEPYAPGKSIGGSRFGNYEGALPEAEGRGYTECDIDTRGAKSRGSKRIVFSNDGLIYYTGDHYETFTLLYGEEEP